MLYISSIYFFYSTRVTLVIPWLRLQIVGCAVRMTAHFPLAVIATALITAPELSLEVTQTSSLSFFPHFGPHKFVAHALLADIQQAWCQAIPSQLAEGRTATD